MSHQRFTVRVRRALPLLALLGTVACSTGSDGPAPAEPGLNAAPATKQTSVEAAYSPAGTEPDDDSRVEVVPGEYLVRFKSETSKSQVDRVLGKAAARSAYASSSVPGLHLVRVAPDTPEAAFKASLPADGVIEFIEPNFIRREHATPNDPEFPRQWGLNNTGQTGGSSTANPDIRAVDAWNITTGSRDIVIAIIDSGIDYNHVDLTANLYRNDAECASDGIDNDGNGYVDDCYGIDTANNDSDPMDDRGHGTHVAGIVGAVGNNGVGVAGVAWSVRLLPCKFLDREGRGNDAAAIRCLDYIAALRARGVNVIASNNSWGNTVYGRALEEAIRAQRLAGILVVAAAGNSGSNNDMLPHYPCTYDVANVICVAATYDAVVQFANFGWQSVHLGAPGEDIISTVPNNAYDFQSGSSMASPHVAGALVLLKTQDSSRDWRALKNLILAGTRFPTEFSIPSVTRGRLDISRSLSCTNSVVRRWLRPYNFEILRRPLGTEVLLRAMSINCALPSGPVTVSINPGGASIQLADSGTGVDEVAGDGIFSGVWNTAGGQYNLTIDGGSGDAITVTSSNWLKTGFPRQLFVTGSVATAAQELAVGSIDTDPELEIMAPELGAFRAWNHDGTELLGWPQYDAGSDAYSSLGEFDGDRQRTDVALNAFVVNARLFRGDGSELPGWPRPVGHATGNLQALATADFDGDGRDEIVAYPARRADGSLFGTNDFPGGRHLAGAPAVADLDGDGKPEVVWSDNDVVSAWTPDGPVPGFPVSQAFTLGTRTAVNTVVGDVDGDGRPEIIVPASVLNLRTHAYEARIQIYSNTGTLKRFIDLGNRPIQAVVLGDLTSDGIPEILTTNHGRLYAWNGAGELLPGWPVIVNAESVQSSLPAIGDLTGDGQPDIVVQGGQANGAGARVTPGLFAFDRLGRPLSSFPEFLPADFVGRTPVIADLDLDGRNELIFALTAHYGRRDALFVYDFNQPGRYGPVEWGQFQEGPARRAFYEMGKNLASDAYLAVQAHGAGTIRSPNNSIDCGTDCVERLPKGTRFELAATASPGAAFLGWRGACAGQPNPCLVSVERYTSVAADFTAPITVNLAGGGGGTVVSEPAGINCPGSCTAYFPGGKLVTLTASATAPSAFDGWSSQCQVAGATCKLTTETARTVEARFVNERPVTVNFLGDGRGRVSSAPAGIDCRQNCSGNFAPNARVLLTAQPDSDSIFQLWNQSCTSTTYRTCEVTVDAAKTVTPVFRRARRVTVQLTGLGRGTVSSLPAGINCGTQCTALERENDADYMLNATAAADSTFVGWSGDCLPPFGNGPCNVLLSTSDVDKTVVANFDLKDRVSVTFTGTGRGTVTSTPNGINCTLPCAAEFPAASQVSLTATPDSGHSFAGWSGACTGTGSCVVTVNRTVTVTANFTAPPPPPPPPPPNPPPSSSGGGGMLQPHELLVLCLLATMGSIGSSRHRRRVFRASPGQSTP